MGANVDGLPVSNLLRNRLAWRPHRLEAAVVVAGFAAALVANEEQFIEDHIKYFAEQKELCNYFLNNDEARAERIDADSIVVKSQYIHDSAVVAVARERAGADQEKLKQENRRTLGEWIQAHGTVNQRQRLAANLLPWKEASDCLGKFLFAPLEMFALYKRFDPDDVCVCEAAGGDECNVKFQSVDATELTEWEWDGNVTAKSVRRSPTLSSNFVSTAPNARAGLSQ